MSDAEQAGIDGLHAEIADLTVENADLRERLKAAEEAEERMNDAFAECRERLSQEIRQREAAEGRIERARHELAVSFNDQRPGGAEDARREALRRLSEPANAEGIASEGGSAQAANPREAGTDAPSAEAGKVHRGRIVGPTCNAFGECLVCGQHLTDADLTAHG
jgi:hypothetical protein